jgi:parallel beta-helix repeat protein
MNRRRFGSRLALCLATLGALPVATRAAAISCTQNALTSAIAAANSAGGGTITFACRDTTIPMTLGLGSLLHDITLDGEGRRITLEYTPVSGCTYSNGGPAIAALQGTGNVIRNLTFKNFLESIQVNGAGNTIEANTFLGHPTCSDDAISLPYYSTAVDNVIRANTFQGYVDKAIQMSYGGGTIEGNTFIDTAQPIRGPYDNSQGEPFLIRNNIFRTSGDRSKCNGPLIDGAYIVEFTGNTVECLRGIRLGGTTQATIRNNTITGNGRSGILLFGHAVASLSGNTITGNGTSPGTQPPGGVVLWEDVAGSQPQADLGAGSLTIGGVVVASIGGNTFTGNGPHDVRNLRTDAYVLRAEGNCWDGTTLGAIAGDVEGSVDFAPFATTCGAPPDTAPVILPLDPAGGDPCAPRTALVSLLVQDLEEAVDPASISVIMNGQAIAPSIAGSGGALTLSFPLPAPLPVDGAVIVQISAADTAVPANTSMLTYGFTLEPPEATGVIAY